MGTVLTISYSAVASWRPNSFTFLMASQVMMVMVLPEQSHGETLNKVITTAGTPEGSPGLERSMVVWQGPTNPLEKAENVLLMSAGMVLPPQSTSSMT